ncbi:DUF3710 domain-containing protein [Corynebacterium lipophiloflavum]|uniref:DUF3710 domain-containing protein n=1 Tax=Corynebacterium lipophiloflavum (strain ATCC 700352 / DSM 44291 / CCUG 37336 / JCM 10383 / DMMZ 1944) TaxID=525263 RepID=C0XSM5_CORLD|nr:DUF3710 domain-containing protein [Corynebacterium lipophiloflavum]EEI16763.1 hypothetical protein HMPREF0298_1445 [Corynebacterium lipophiloflavum DSM 44291]
MALWPFGKKIPRKSADELAAAQGSDEAAQRTDADARIAVEDSGAPADLAEVAGVAEAAEGSAAPVSIPHDPVSGDTGPFDGDSVNIDEFDFTDFSNATLNLGSMRIPLPAKSQVQVEMGETGPKMVHIVTRHGRATPVAFASTRSGGLWEQSSEEIAEGMRSEGMPVTFETGPWGREIVGTGANGVIRIIGVEGPRWLYRVTLAAPNGMEDDMAALGRDLVARSFVYRGTDPFLAGNSLPVVLPAQLAQQVQQAVQARAVQPGQPKQPGQPGQQAPAATPSALAEAMKQVMDANSARQPAPNEGERNS